MISNSPKSLNVNNYNQKMQIPRDSTETKPLRIPTKTVQVEDFLLVLFVFSSNLAYYLIHDEIVVIILGIVLSFSIFILILLYYIAEHMNYRFYKTILFPGLYFFTGLGFIFQDPDILRVFLSINSQSAYLPSLLSLILLSINCGSKELVNVNITFASIILGVLSFCLTINQHDTTERSVYLFIAYLGVIFQNIKNQYLKRKNKLTTVFDEYIEDQDSEMEFEDITTKLQLTSELLIDVLHNSKSFYTHIQQSIINIKAISACLQKKANIYAVQVNSITKHMDEQDRVFIEESCFDGQIKISDVSNHGIKIQHEVSLVVTELMGLLKNIGKDWNFNTFFFADCCENNPLQVAGYYAFNHFGLDELFKIPEQVLKSFLMSLEETYKPNPYHNSSHATDVMNSHIYLLCNSKLLHCISSLDIMAGIIASLGHDSGHPAKNNRFLILTKDELAIQYNDISVLEMLHTSLIFKIMKIPDSNIFMNLTSEQ